MNYPTVQHGEAVVRLASTHWDGCWRAHPECAEARFTDEQFTGGTSRFAAVQDEE